MHSASAKIDGEPYALRGARTVRGEALGNLFSNAEQGALRLLHVRTFRLCRNEYTSDLDSCAVWELPSTITDDTMHLTA